MWKEPKTSCSLITSTRTKKMKKKCLLTLSNIPWRATHKCELPVCPWLVKSKPTVTMGLHPFIWSLERQFTSVHRPRQKCGVVGNNRESLWFHNVFPCGYNMILININVLHIYRSPRRHCISYVVVAFIPNIISIFKQKVRIFTIFQFLFNHLLSINLEKSIF